MKTVTISMDAYLQCLQDRYDNAPSNWKGAADRALFPLLLKLIEDTGVDPEHSDPSEIVDNFLVNGEMVYREDWDRYYSRVYNKYDGDWEEFCENECLLYDNMYACIQF